MKKGLSILLVAAALFGFYGGATNLNDVLACKDYWEKAGEESTANMNKLEDGLNQLKENEAAYLDGKDQIAEGEKTLADGEAQYAQGLADYEAAPAKLADGERQIADGEKKLADGYAQYNQGQKDLKDGKAAVAKGKKDLASLNTLIDGIEQVLKGYPTFKDGYKALRDGRVGAIEKPSDTTQLQQVLMAYYQNANDAYAGKALQSLQAAGAALAAQDKNSFTNQQYDGFKDYLEKTKAALDDANAFFDNLKTTHNTVGTVFTSALQGAQPAAQAYGEVATLGAEAQKAQAEAQADPTEEKIAAAQKAAKAYQDACQKYGGDVETLRKALNDKLAVCKASASPQLAGAVQLAANVFIASKDQALAQQVLGALSAVQGGLEVGEKGENADKLTSYLTAVGTIPVALTSVNAGITDTQNQTIAAGKNTADQWLNGYAKITSKDTQSAQKTLVGGVAQIIGGVLSSGNDELINGLNAVAKQVGFKATDFTPAASSQLAKDMASDSALENFYNDMNKVEKGFQTVLPSLKNKSKTGASDLAAGEKAVAEGEKKLASAKKQLAQGEKDLAAGKAELAQGKADYAAAPGKLADAEKQLADGRQALADGKAKLAEYEDGEQQVRDGLATLTGTEADLSLKSIFDRLNGDDDFDNGDNHLELDEGLAAVEVGRGYQAEDGVLITEEIMARAVGTGALLGAGALAVLAAILSFLKKNKAAGVFAVLAAAAGAFGAFYGTQAGTYFSSIAGSTVGATGWIAAGVLGAVALVHAIVHFAAGKEA